MFLQARLPLPRTLKHSVILLHSKPSYLIFLYSLSPSSMADPDPSSCECSAKIIGHSRGEGEPGRNKRQLSRPWPQGLGRVPLPLYPCIQIGSLQSQPSATQSMAETSLPGGFTNRGPGDLWPLFCLRLMGLPSPIPSRL